MRPDPEEAHLRLARASDAAAMAAWSRDLIETGLPWTYDTARVTGLINDSDTVALVAGPAAQTAGTVHGFAILHCGDEHAHLVLLCVRPQQQRRGLGGALIGWLLKSARAAGMASVHLELRADNLPALGFYRKLGFVEVQRVAGYYAIGVDARRMHLPLRLPVRQGSARSGPTDTP